MFDMTTANRREHGNIDDRDAYVGGLVDDAIRKFNRDRRRRGERMMSQQAIALKIFGRNEDWLAKRRLGQTSFTPFELVDVANFLGVNVIDWLNEAKLGPTGPSDASPELPRLDSNQQPFDYKANAPVTDLAEYRRRLCDSLVKSA